MKKVFSHLITLLFISVMMSGCDFVQNANPEIEPSFNGNSSVIYKKVLVEDYTGHKCGNCPAAADVLKTLESQYAGKIVPMAIHAGFFATVNTSYPTDFRTTAGNAYDSQFGISAAGNPNGLINRAVTSGGFIKSYSVWGSEISQQITEVAKFQVKIMNNYNAGSSSVNTDITVKSLANNNGLYKLVVLLTEDSVIAEQLDYRISSGSQLVPNYEFNHVLRGAINSEWGDAIFTTAANLNDSVVKSYPNFIINPAFRARKCHVVAYVYDADPSSPTYYEVLQVEEAEVE
ncbi:MAG: omp28 [Bacteroidetes bacterium]|jgi:thiol-disulfide isomerase/thioredoxin|nr:omp28 [Bacteroidota bacterium]MDF2452555.1 omp28 [Bacteroidota bacterium]